MSSEPFISPNIFTGDRSIDCLICSKVIGKNEPSAKLTSKNWNTFKLNAARWSSFDIPNEDEKNVYTLVYSKIVDADTAFGIIHDKCRISFGATINRAEKKYGIRTETENDKPTTSVDVEASTSQHTITRSKVIKPSTKRHCFVCDKIRDVDDNQYNKGGLGRCSQESARDKILERMQYFLTNPENRFYDSAERLKRLLGGDSHDIFSADIFYHQSCYIKFAIKNTDLKTIDEQIQENKKATVLEIFLQRLKAKIIREKCAYLLNELLEDIYVISDDQSLQEPPITNTRSLKRLISDTYEDDISFFPMGKYLLVHASEMNPCEYTLATLHGCGMRDENLTKAFGKMIRRKIQAMDKQEEWPLSPEKFLQSMDKCPMPELFNAIFFSMHDSGKVNEFGYAELPSYNEAMKIWSLASDWESLITKQPNPKTATMGLVIHRLTRSKEVIDILHKSSHTISYKNIRLQNSAWAKMYHNKRLMLSNMRKGVTTHSTIDNNDGNQETMTGSGTTHDTNKTLFQNPSKIQLETILPTGCANLDPCDLDDDEFTDPIPFEIGSRLEPELFTDFKEKVIENDELDNCFKKDIAWSIAGSLPAEFCEQKLPLLGSWTPFNKSVTQFFSDKCIQEYLPVTPHPPEYPVCKEYLDFLLEIIDELELKFIFVHSDEAVYSKLCHILWNNKDLYKRIILLMGGFHELRVKQKLLFKRHSCRGFRQWSVDAGTIAEGSADRAWEGRHYYRCMRVHKECFDALVQYKFEHLTSNLENIQDDLKKALISLRLKPTHASLNELLSTDSFVTVVTQIRKCGETEFSSGNMTLEYLKDVSSMLAMVSAVREGCLERHLQSEREMIKQVFAFGHHNYARYLSYQYVSLRSMEYKNHPALIDLKENGFGGSISGEPFSTIHGDLITELFNKETKGTRGPMRAGFSTDYKSVNEWIASIHLHAKIREEYRKLLMIKTSSKHKEMTNGGKLKHSSHVSALKKKLAEYGSDPFDDSVAKCLTSGEEIHESVRKDMVSAPVVGNTLFLSFLNERLKTRKASFFSRIINPKLNTGVVKKVKPKKVLDVMKEDRQAFGVLVAKSVSLEEAFKFPVTSVPLAVSNPDGSLRQGDKASLRNMLIENSCSTISLPPENCTWLIDGMSVIQTVKPQETYEEFFKKVIEFIDPPSASNPKAVGMINDIYKSDSIKEGTRRTRGVSGSKVSIEGFKQHMLKGLQWKEFLNHGENKDGLIASLASFMKSEKGRSLFKYPFIMTSRDETFLIEENISLLHLCNHEEADTRLVLHAYMANSDVVIVATDTDILMIMIWVYHMHNISFDWYFKFKHNKFASISRICSFLGPVLCENILAFHGLSGCDTTSYFYRIGKVRVMKKLLESPLNACLLQELGKDEFPNEKTLDNAKEFIRLVMYNGKEGQEYIDTRISKYKALTTKTSSAIPPDQDSVAQVILRAHHQIFKWKSSTQIQMTSLTYKEYGWKWSNELSMVVPVWFVGYQLPKDLRKKTKKDMMRIDVDVVDFEADDEGDGQESVRPAKRRKKNQAFESTNIRNISESQNADIDTTDSNTFDLIETTDSCNENDSHEEEWEVSDFASSNDSGDEWTPDK